MSKSGIQYLLKHGRAASPVTTRTNMPKKGIKALAGGGPIDDPMRDGGLGTNVDYPGAFIPNTHTVSDVRIDPYTGQENHFASGGRVYPHSLYSFSPYDMLSDEQLASLPNAYRDAIVGHPDTGGKAYFYDPMSQRYTSATGGVRTITSGNAVANPLGNLGGGGGGDRNAEADDSGWASMTDGEKAAYYSQNPTMAAITQMGQKAFGLTSLGQLQKAMVPSFVERQELIAQGIDPDNISGQGNAYGTGFTGDSGLGVDGTAGEAEAAANADAVNAQAQADVEAAAEANSEANAAAAAAEGAASVDGGGIDSMARGGLASLARGGATGSLGAYSDGGQLLRGPGDGVSDSIPARIGRNQPARLADGEFVIPARIVSELGNGSTEAGSRKLYAMMQRIQQGRKKTMGKNAYAKDTKAEKKLPA